MGKTPTPPLQSFAPTAAPEGVTCREGDWIVNIRFGNVKGADGKEYSFDLDSNTRRHLVRSYANP